MINEDQTSPSEVKKNLFEEKVFLLQGYNWSTMVLSRVENYLGNRASNLFHVLSNTEVRIGESSDD